jgi:hypothetical protein
MNLKLSGLTMFGCSTQCGTTQRDYSPPDSFTSFGELLLVHYLKIFSDQISAVGNLHIAVIAAYYFLTTLRISGKKPASHPKTL